MSSKLAIFTEADARVMTCPVTRSVQPIAGVQIQDSPCLASRCMAWRWMETNISPTPGADLEPSPDTYGYCGLAGSPVPKPR